METTFPQRQADFLRLAIAKEKKSFARHAAAARTCTDPNARRLYNELALEELKHLLTLASLMDGLAETWLAQLDLTLPITELPDPLPQREEALLPLIMEEGQSQSFFGHLAQGVDREELLALLKSLRADEEEHRTRLLSLLYGMEVGRPVMAKGPRSIHRMISAASLR